MAPQFDRLAKIAQEGFALVDECYGRKGYQNPPHRHQPCVYHGPQTSRIVTVAPSVANSYEIARQFSDGIATAGRHTPAMTSDQAAEYYGGMVIMEYGSRRKPFRRA